MRTILTPCRVPWAVSPSMGCVTLSQAETDVEPECTVVFCGYRLTDEYGQRRVAIEFEQCYYSRTCPLNGGGVDRLITLLQGTGASLGIKPPIAVGE